MISPDAFIQRWLHTFLFGVWMALLLYLLATGRYMDFLRPEFGWLLVPAIFIAMGFMIAAMACNRFAEVDLSNALRAAVLLLPLVYLIALPDAMLGGVDFKNRFVGTSGIASITQEPTGEVFPWDRNDIGGDPPEDDPAEVAAATECSITDLYRQADRYDSRQVMFTGMIMRDEALKEYFDGRDTVVFRFMITCCAADALPLAIAVDSDPSTSFDKDQWVRVSGTFSLHRIDDKSFPLVVDAAIEPIEAPAAPYLF
jgi:uncharacterized repeat protein (TIGR03943 family)